MKKIIFNKSIIAGGLVNLNDQNILIRNRQIQDGLIIHTCNDYKDSLEVIKELPITLILRPFNFETFATQAYIYASQDLLEAAALPSLFLIFWSTILILLSSKYILSKKN